MARIASDPQGRGPGDESSARSAAASTRGSHTGRRSGGCAGERAGLELAGCCDVDPERAESFRADFGYARAWGDPAQCSTRSGRTPSSWSSRWTRRSPSARSRSSGDPLLLEKPPGETPAGTDRLIAAAERGGAVVPHQVAFNRRFAPLVRELRRRIEEAGPLQHLHYEMTRVERRDPDFSTTAIHGLDAVRYLAGADYAEARFRYHEMPELGPGVANILVDAVMATGATAHLAFCPVGGVLVERAAAHAHGHTLFLHVPMWSGRRLARPAVALRPGGRLAADLGGDRVGDGTALFELGGFYRETVAFLDALAAGRAPSPGLRESRQSVEIAERIRRPRERSTGPSVGPHGTGERMKRVSLAATARRRLDPGGVARARGGARPHPQRPPRRLEGDRPRRRRDDAPSRHQPARPAGLVLLGCDMTGAYVTATAGLVADVQLRRPDRRPSPSIPRRPRPIYAGAGAVYRSDDSGTHVADGPAGPGPNTHRGERHRTDHGDFVLFTDDPAYPGSGRSVTFHAIAVDEDDPNRASDVAASAAESPSRARAHRDASADSEDRGRTLDEARSHGAGARSSRSSTAVAGVACPVADRREGRVREPQRRLAAPSRPRHRARLTSASFGRDPALGRRVRLRHDCRSSREPTGGPWGALRLRGRGSAAGGRRTALLRSSSELGPGEWWGNAAKGSRPSLGPVAASARFPLVAYVGPAGAEFPAGGPKFNGIAKTTDGGRSFTSSTPSRTASRRTSSAPGSSARGEDEGTPLVRRALRPRGGAGRPRRRLRDRPLPHLPDRGRRRDLEPGELGAARQRTAGPAAASTS
jgi:myo-inositol 2-dehydrogenase / D-chiro-inositol 1-dehydrogenase